MSYIKIQRRGWQDEFTYREAVIFLKSLSQDTLGQYVVTHHGEQENGSDFLEKCQEESSPVNISNQAHFSVLQNEEGALFFENEDISIQISRKQFQKLLQKEYVHQLNIDTEKAIQYYQNQLF